MIFSFAVPLKLLVPQAETRKEPTQSSLREFSRFTLRYLSGGQSTCSSKMSYQWAIFVPHNIFCCNMFECFLKFNLISQTSGKYQWGFRALWPAAWGTNIQSICWFFHYFAHFRAWRMESTIFWQTMLGTFIDNPSAHFFSLHLLGFYMSIGSLRNLAEKVTALSCRV